jgi:hypothetical protein
MFHPKYNSTVRVQLHPARQAMMVLPSNYRMSDSSSTFLSHARKGLSCDGDAIAVRMVM